MEQYVVSARKYRPSTFASVVGQKALTGTLRNAVVSGRLASSYLFCGGRGVGKTTCARIFAKAINCENLSAEGEPCNECRSCRDFNSGASMNIVELDAASNNGVDNIRDLVDKVQVPPSSGKYRVFIVDEVHMLSSAAFNAFLKTLEEPPSYVVFILATTEKHKIIPTILSRCQIYDFHRITISDMVEHMKYVAGCEGIEADEAALTVIAHKADGAMRDALSIFDQVAASSRGRITYESAIENLNVLDRSYYKRLMDCFVKGDVLGSWMIYKEVRDKGFDSLFFVNGLADYLRDVLAATTDGTLELIEASAGEKAELRELAKSCSAEMLLRGMDLCNDCDMAYRTSSGKQFLVELTLAKLCQPVGPFPNDGTGKGQLAPIAPAVGSAAQAVPASNTVKVPGPAAQTITATPAGSGTVAQTIPATPAESGTVAQTVSRPRVTLRQPNISISGRRGVGDPGSSGHAGKRSGDLGGSDGSDGFGKRTGGYSAEQLKGAWESYIASHPKEHVLVNAMMSGFPQPKGGDVYEVTVFNDFQREAFERSMADILNHLHGRLGNDMVRIEVRVNEGAPPRHTLNDRDLLKEMSENNPMLRKYIEGFKLKL